MILFARTGIGVDLVKSIRLTLCKVVSADDVSGRRMQIMLSTSKGNIYSNPAGKICACTAFYHL